MRKLPFVVPENFLLEKYLPHPMQSCREGLTPFPHADLLSLIDKFKDKNKYFSTCMHLESYTTWNTLVAPLQPAYIEICAKKSKLNVGFPCHDRRSLILGLPYTGNVPTRPFSCILKAIKKPIPSYGKEREFNFESKVALEKLLLHY
jgi:hypothetical protein